LADFFTAGFAAADFFFVDASAISTPFVAGALSMPVSGFDSVILLRTLARAVACLDADFAAKSKASRTSGADARRRGRPVPPHLRAGNCRQGFTDRKTPFTPLWRVLQKNEDFFIFSSR
jgi:hypothetical protein